MPPTFVFTLCVSDLSYFWFVEYDWLKVFVRKIFQTSLVDSIIVIAEEFRPITKPLFENVTRSISFIKKEDALDFN